MTRRIICQKCKDKRGPQHPEDVAMGWHRRIVPLQVKKPEVHQVKVYADGKLEATEDLATIVCDDCGNAMPDGTNGFALTMWRGEEPPTWEDEYGRIV
jgi:hypothetical protein